MLKLIGKYNDFIRYRETYTPSRTIFVGNLQRGKTVLKIVDSKSGVSNCFPKILLDCLNDKINDDLSLSIYIEFILLLKNK